MPPKFYFSKILLIPLEARIGIQNYLSELLPNFHCPLLLKSKSKPSPSVQSCYGHAMSMDKTNPTREAQMTGSQTSYQAEGSHRWMKR